MSTLALVLVIIAAFAHATWNLASKKAAASGVVFIWLSAVASAVLWLPVGGRQVLVDGVSWSALLLGAVVSAFLHGGYMLLLQRGYAAGDISVVYPMARGTGPLFSVAFAIVILKEEATLAGLLGTLLVVGGVVVIGMPRASVALSRLQPRARVGILYGLATGVAIAIYTLWDAYAVTDLGLDPVTFMVGCAIGEVVLLLPAALRHRGRLTGVLKADWRSVLVVGVLSPVSYVLVLTAITMAPVSLVAPARELSVVLVSLAGWLLLKEPHPVQRLVGSVVVLGGVVLLAGV